RPLELHQFDLLAVQFANDLGLPRLGEAGELLGQVDLIHTHRFCLDGGRRRAGENTAGAGSGAVYDRRGESVLRCSPPTTARSPSPPWPTLPGWHWSCGVCPLAKSSLALQQGYTDARVHGRTQNGGSDRRWGAAVRKGQRSCPRNRGARDTDDGRSAS